MKSHIVYDITLNYINTIKTNTFNMFKWMTYSVLNVISPKQQLHISWYHI